MQLFEHHQYNRELQSFIAEYMKNTIGINLIEDVSEIKVVSQAATLFTGLLAKVDKKHIERDKYGNPFPYLKI